jgi:hypothetical protein
MTAAIATITQAATDTAAIALAVFSLVVGIKVFKWARTAL